METICLMLVFLHVLIMIFATINLHPHLSLIANGADHGKQISAIIRYVTDFLCISLYHITSILGVWFNRRYGAGIIRASGILLIGEILHVITLVIQHAVEMHRLGGGEVFFSAIHLLTLLITVIITYRLAAKILKHQHDSMRIELLIDGANNTPMDNNTEPIFV